MEEWPMNEMVCCALKTDRWNYQELIKPELAMPAILDMKNLEQMLDEQLLRQKLISRQRQDHAMFEIVELDSFECIAARFDSIQLECLNQILKGLEDCR